MIMSKKIFVIVKAKTNQSKIEKTGEDNFCVWVKELPIDGRANKKVLRLIAKYFKVPASNMSIISGLKGRKKIIKIND